MTKVILFNDDNNQELQDSCFILGSFESFHKGHLKLLEKAKEYNKKITILLFENPEILPKNNQKFFSDLFSRIQVIANLKINYILLLKFDENIKNTDGYDFINLLIKKGATKFIIGSDFKLGKNGLLNAQKIKDYFADTEIVELYKENERKISTSFLKELLVSGNFEAINKNLVENFFIKAKINFKNEVFFLKNQTIFPAGIYLCYLIWNEKKYPVILWRDFVLKKDKIFFFEGLKVEIESIEIVFIEFVKQKRIITTEIENQLTTKEKEEIKKLFSY
ncbi:FAD synthase [Mycoplasma sp. 1012]